MIGSDATGVYAIVDRKWRRPSGKEFFRGSRGRREAPVKAHHQLCRRSRRCRNHTVELTMVKSQRLFDKHMTATLKSGACQLSVRIVTRRDDYQVRIRIVDHIGGTRHAEVKSILLANVTRGNAGSCRNCL